MLQLRTHMGACGQQWLCEAWVGDGGYIGVSGGW